MLDSNGHELQITLVFLPAADIASYVGEGNVDLGITGLDVIQETVPDDEVELIMRLGFGKCKLAVQAPVANNITSVSQLAGKRIVTSFPTLARRFFQKHESAATGETKIKFVSGSVEAACGLGLADAVVDLVETGTTMRAAGLDIVETIMETEAVLIGNPNSTHCEILNTIKLRIDGYITATKYQVPRRLLLYDSSERLVHVLCHSAARCCAADRPRWPVP
jgi:ATP phosphoribosyltransferase